MVLTTSSRMTHHKHYETVRTDTIKICCDVGATDEEIDAPELLFILEFFGGCRSHSQSHRKLIDGRTDKRCTFITVLEALQSQ